jgi:sterol desaturase/sphingolipid hydroxylase (fatty acid hydroxylase superfamily)
MNLPASILSAGLAFVVLALIFRPLERVFPAKPKQAFFRPAFFLDLSFFLGQYLFWNGAVLWLLNHFGDQVQSIVPADFRAWVGSYPLWAQAIVVMLISDVLIYWGHRFQHRCDLLWRFHAIHHSAEHLDWLAAHREHPLDTVFTVGLVNLPIFISGFDLQAIGLVVGFRGLWAIYIHSNVKLPIGPLRMLIGAPELHHWHHDRDRDAGNYANVSPIMDLIFGTYVHPGHEPESFGLREPIPRSYVAQLLHPFRRTNRRSQQTSLHGRELRTIDKPTGSQ